MTSRKKMTPLTLVEDIVWSTRYLRFRDRGYRSDASTLFRGRHLHQETTVPLGGDLRLASTNFNECSMYVKYVEVHNRHTIKRLDNKELFIICRLESTW